MIHSSELAAVREALCYDLERGFGMLAALEAKLVNAERAEDEWHTAEENRRAAAAMEERTVAA